MITKQMNSKFNLKNAVLIGLITITLISLLTMPMVSATTATPRTWIVDNTFRGDFTSIQQAVNAASSGDTILIRPRYYFENVNVNKPLMIQSKTGPRNTIVVALNSNDHVFEIMSDGVAINGLGIEGAWGWGTSGIFTNANYGIISNNEVFDNQYGVHISNARNNTIANNFVSDNRFGIYLSNSNSNVLTNNNAVDNWNAGISIERSNANSIIGNNASDNDRGIILTNSNNNVISTNNCVENVMGIFLLSSNNNEVTHNMLIRNRFAGLDIVNSVNNIVFGNTIISGWI